MRRWLTRGGRYTPEDPDYRRVVLLSFSLAALILVSALFAALNAWVFQLGALVWLNLATLLAASALALTFWRSGQLAACAQAAVLVLGAALLGYVWLVGNRFGGLIWLTAFPGIALFLLGNQRGLMACLAFFGCAALLLGLQAPGWQPEAFGPAAAANVIMVLGCLLLLAHFHEQSRQEVLHALHERNQALQRLSSTDRLTGLANRLQLEQALERGLSRRARTALPLSVLLLDLDHFKRVNDGYGHATGDAVLKAVADVLGRELRGSDLAGRWGGEEFLMVCDEPLQGARRLGERVRAAVAVQPMPGVPAQTVSIGVAEARPGETAEALMARADAALYAAKAAGRDRVEVAS